MECSLFVCAFTDDTPSLLDKQPMAILASIGMFLLNIFYAFIALRSLILSINLVDNRKITHPLLAIKKSYGFNVVVILILAGFVFFLSTYLPTEFKHFGKLEM